MTHRLAIIFDSSGTLMHMYRVAKEIETGEMLRNIASLHLVHGSQALVAIDTPPDALFNYSSEQTISHLLEENDIEINIGCAGDEITTSDVRDVLNRMPDTARVSDLWEVISAVQEKCTSVFYTGAGFVLDVPTGTIPYVVCTAGKLFDGAKSVVTDLLGCADIYIASGDSMRNLRVLAKHLKIPQENVVPVATPLVKERLVENLKTTYDGVVMVGDEINDLRAILAADLGVLTLQQRHDKSRKLYDSADMVIGSISELPEILRCVPPRE